MPARSPTPTLRVDARAAFTIFATLAAGGGLLAASLALARAVRPPGFRIVDPEGPPTLDAAGRARSVQAADLPLRPATFAAIFSPDGPDRLARAYWRFLTRITLGLIRVVRTPDAELVVLLGRPAVLLAFGLPDCRLEPDRALITWEIRGGLLAVRQPAGPDGSLTIDLRRLDRAPLGAHAVRVEVSVAGFRPTIARRFGRTAYALTQARVHVFVTHSFMRWLARARLACPRAPAESRPTAGSPTPRSREHRSEISGNSI